MNEAERILNSKGYYITNQFDGFFGTITDEYELYKNNEYIMDHLSESQIIALASILWEKREDKDMCRTMNELEKVVADYRSLKALKEDLEEQLKDIEREIIGYMDSNEKLAETVKDFTIKLSTCERRTVDTKRLEADLGSLTEYQKISQYRRLYVK
mgnify:CR=1 FL=1